MKKILTLFTALILFGSMTVVKADTWTVAGTPAAFFGTTWDLTNLSNIMAEQSDGTYRWEKEPVSPNELEFKVVKGNDNWNEAYPSSNYYMRFQSGSKLVITFNPSTKAVNAFVPGGYVGIHGNMTSSNWATVEMTASSNKETATFTYTNLPEGTYEFGMRLFNSDDFTSNGLIFRRDNPSRVITRPSGSSVNCALMADVAGDYTFTWTYATNTMEVTFPALPEKSVVFNGLESQILKGSEVSFAAISENITNPVYSYYVKPANGEYGSAVTSYTFDTNGEFVVKVEAIGDGMSEPVSKEQTVNVYSTYTFTSGTRIYVDFSAMTEGDKGVNYPYGNQVSNLDYDKEGAGTFKTIQFSQNVTWSTLNDFIKTQKNSWAGLKFTAPESGQNKVIVAADGASYAWGTYTPETVQVKFFAPKNVDHPWDNVYAYSWDAAGTLSAAWPGDAVTTKEDEWYVYTVLKGANLLFHDNNNLQTNDITDVQADVCYIPTEIVGTKVTVAEQCSVDYYISGTKKLTGLSSDWVVADENLKLDANNQIVFENLAAGSYEFKITNGTWAWSIGGGDHLDGECATIATTTGLGNVGFTIGNTQDVTITYYPATEKICLGAVTVKSAASISVEDMTAYISKARSINPTYTSDATEVQYEILDGDEYITIADGKITGVAEGTATVRATVPETDNYLSASDEFTVTVEPLKYYLKNNWNGGEWIWKEMTAVGGTFKLENVVYGGEGINYNYIEDATGAVWKDYTKIKYMDGETPKLVEAFDEVNLVLDPASDTIWAEMAQKNNPVYTVASNSLALCDLGWAPTHPYKYTDMKKQTDGTYMWNHEDAKVILPAGEVKLKIFKDRSYDNGSWPASDFVYNIQRSGEYEITVHFNPWTKEITIDTTCVKPLNIQVPLYIKGSWNNWSATPMLLGGYNDKAIVTLSFAETGTYNFKLEDVKEKWYGDGQSFTRNNSSHKDIEAKEESATIAMTIQVDKAGEYLVTYFYDGEILLVQYPAIAPAEPIAPLNGKFTINAKGDTAVFSRGNLHYNYESDAWYAAENQYDALGDLNLRFGDATYTGSIDLFGWSSENSDFGKQWKYRDEEFAGDFVDWGTLFAGDEKEWSTLSIAEWQFLLARTKDNHNLWTILAIGPDSLSGLVLFPDNWEAPAGLTIKYGFFDLEKEEDLRANSFSYEQWEAMETAGAVFLPLAGQRAGYYGNTWDGNKENNLSNPLASGYDWVDEVNGMTYYWTSTPDGEIRAYCFSVPGFNATSWLAPMPLNRERRRGHPVRLVTRIPKVEWTELRTGLEVNRHYTVCYEKNITAIDGATFWNLEKRNTEGTLAYLEEVTAPEAGKPYIIQATKETLKVVYGNESENDPVENGALRGTFVYMSGADLEAKGSDVYMLFNNELRPIGTNNHLDAHRAYILYNQLESVSSAPNAAPGKRVKAMPMQRDAAQGFENIESGDKPMKVMIDGALYILRGENVYDATGRLVK